MLLVIILLAGIGAGCAAVAALLAGGLRHGDLPADATVSVRALADTGEAGGPGWLEVTVSNPGASTALVSLGLRRRRRRREWASLRAPGERRTAGRRIRLQLSDGAVGAVPGADQAIFWLWGDGDRRELSLTAAVGTPGRLRMHRIALDTVPRLAPAAAQPMQSARAAS